MSEPFTRGDIAVLIVGAIVCALVIAEYVIRVLGGTL